MLISQAMMRHFEPGDFLIFQLESGFALLRVLEVNEIEGIWHLAAYKEFFLDPELADRALDGYETLQIDRAHLALTNHGFESTQVARLRNVPLTQDEMVGYQAWKHSKTKEVHDRSIRLLLGLR